MKHCITLRYIWLFAAVAIAAHFGTSPAQAQSIWDGGGAADSNWSTPGNWVGDVAPPNDGSDNIQFAGALRTTPVTDVAWSLNSLTYNAGASSFTNSGSPLTIGSGGITNNSTNLQTINNQIVVGAAQTWNAASGNLTFGSTATIDNGGHLLTISGAANTTISGVLSGGGGLTKNGTGTLTLGAVNTFTGPVIVSAGTLIGSVDGALPDGVDYTINGGTLDLNDFNLTMSQLSGTGGMVDLGSAALTVNQTTSTSYAGVITGTGSLTKQGAGTLTLTGNNNYSGGTTVSAGTLQGTTSSLQGNITDNANVTFDQTTTGTYSGVISGSGTVTKTGTGTVILTGANSYNGGTTITTGTLQGNTTSLQGTIHDNATLTFDQASAGTFAGTIDGTGVVNKTGAGTLTFNQANTYSGATTINQGTLALGANNVMPDGGAVNVNGGTFDINTRSDTVGAVTLTSGSITGTTGVLTGTSYDVQSGTVSAILGGAGALTKTMAGTVILSGANTYSGGTTVSTGTLQGDTTSLHGNITDNATLTFSQSNNGTYAGVISGSGNVIKTGTGTVTVSGTNTYIGGTNVNQGTFALGNNNVLADAGAVTVNGGTFDINSRTETVGAVTLTSGSITGTSGVLTGASYDLQSGTVSANLAGTGTLNKNGSGTVTISSANNTYTGATTVNAGRLDVTGAIVSATTVAAGGTLGGTGAISANVINNGTIVGGTASNTTGALNINGGNTLDTSGGTMQVNVTTTSGVNSKINVNSGNATLSGGDLNITSAPGNYNAGQTYTFLTYSSKTGQFGTVTDDINGLDAVITYNANNAVITLLRNGQTYAAVAQTRNQSALGGYLDRVSPNASGDLQTVLNGINNISNAEARSAFSQMGGAIHGTLGQIGIQNTTLVVQQIGYRLRSAPFAAGGDDDSPGQDGPPGPMEVGSAGKHGDSSPVVLVGYNPDGSPCLQQCPDGRHSCNGWVQGFGLGGSAKSDGNVLGLNYAMGGVVAGSERWADDCHMFGFWGGYVGSTVESDGNQSINGGQLGGYMFSDNGNSYSIWMGGLEFDDYSTERRLAFDDIDRSATASYDGWQAFGYWERGVTYGTCNRVIQPFMALQYIYLRQNGFSEGGANSIDLLSGGLDTRSFRSLLGARLQYAMYARNGKRFLPEVHALWLHEYLNSNTVVTASFAGATTPGAFAVNGLDLGRDWAMLGASATWELGGGWNMFVNYDCQTNSEQTFHVGSGGLGHMW